MLYFISRTSKITIKAKLENWLIGNDRSPIAEKRNAKNLIPKIADVEKHYAIYADRVWEIFCNKQHIMPLGSVVLALFRSIICISF